VQILGTDLTVASSTTSDGTPAAFTVTSPTEFSWACNDPLGTKHNPDPEHSIGNDAC
jgi:hypothetical protein